ncbi:hypothetical protein E8E14_004260 [Neopestalotiopsis sp. 37M]|nr:hypothetical protein E8E14_004260 [Neopestalotiopsis sp. 37M]
MSPLFAIKNVAEFHATSLFAKFRTTNHYPDLYCDAETAEISTLPPYIWPYADLDSPLQRLELLESNVDVESIGALLAHTPCLRVFRYSHVPIATSDRPFHRDDEEAAIREYRKYSWDAAAFVDTVAKHCGHQLTELAITFGDRCKRFGITNAVTNMKDFARLEHAELEVAIFGGSDELPTFDQHNAPRDINVPRLVDILPSSLKRLDLFDGFLCDPEAVVALMRDFAAGRTWLLSDLEEISYRHREYCEQIYPRPYYSAIERQADAQDISYASGPSIQAHWARSFGKTPGFDPMSKPTNWQDVYAGETFQIVWDPTSYKGTITLELLGGGSPATLWILGNIAQGVDNQQGQYNWVVPANLGQLDTYGIRILLESNPSILQYSFPFHVRPASARPSTQSAAQSSPQAAAQTRAATQPAAQTTAKTAVNQPTTSTNIVTTPKSTLVATTQPAPQPTAQTTTKLPDRCKVRRRWAPTDFGYSKY